MKKNKFYSFLRGFLFFPIKILFPTKVIGKEQIPLPEKIITVSNHFSLMDIFILGVNVKGFRHMLGKKELENSRFIRLIMRGVGAIGIDRGKVDLSAMRKVMGVLNEGGSITMFPEGTRNKSGSDEMQEVKAGASLFAIKGQAQVVPIMLYRKPRLFRKNYLYVSQPFNVAELSARADSATVASGAKIIEDNMREASAYLADYVQNKRWKKKKLKESENVIDKNH